MSGLDQLQYITWLLYVLIFFAVLVRAIRRPTPAHVDMTLFFGSIALIILFNTLFQRLGVAAPEWLVNDVTGIAAISWGYLLLRLVRDFSEVPRWLMRAVELGLVVAAIAFLLVPPPLPPLVTLPIVAYLVAVIAYDTFAFVRQAHRTRGVTRRRMQAAAAGSLCITLVLFMAGLQVALPFAAGAVAQISAFIGALSGVCYFVGFAPPNWLRRAWQEPEIRSFLARAATLPRLPDTRAMVRALEQGAADALGAPAASIALWNADERRLRVFYRPPLFGSAPPEDAGTLDSDEGLWRMDPHQRPVIGQAFLQQRALLVTDAATVDPDHAALFRQYGARAVLSAPISAGDKHLGALIVYAPRAPVFANSDLELVQLLADQAAVILESRALIDEAAGVRAREEAARLKEDFLSSAAHDLKTPLTGLVTQAQVLQRRAERDPRAPADRVGINRLLEQSLRLRDLVLELLDVARMEQGGLLGEIEPVDLAVLVRDLVALEPTSTRIDIDAPAPVYAPIDSVRFTQVVRNLVENAVKYSPPGSRIAMRLWLENREARLCVQDRGIGIPLEDQPLIFERFHRARNVDDRRFAGMGLGLYIARGIVEQHGGRIWVSSLPGEGSTFHVALPSVTAAIRSQAEEPASADTAPESRLASA